MSWMRASLPRQFVIWKWKSTQSLLGLARGCSGSDSGSEVTLAVSGDCAWSAREEVEETDGLVPDVDDDALRVGESKPLSYNVSTWENVLLGGSMLESCMMSSSSARSVSVCGCWL